MVRRIIIPAAVLAALLLWLGPIAVPDWAVIGFVFGVLLPVGIVLTVRRLRLEIRLAHRLWLALTRQ
jgi:hypothetical protein